MGWIFKEAWLCSLTDWNSVNSYDPLLTGSSLLRGEVFFFYPLYAKHSCFYLEQLPTSSSSLLGPPPLFQVTDSRSLAAHNSFIHSLNRYLLHTYYVPWTLFPFLLALIKISFSDFCSESDIVGGSCGGNRGKGIVGMGWGREAGQAVSVERLKKRRFCKWAKFRRLLLTKSCDVQILGAATIT